MEKDDLEKAIFNFEEKILKPHVKKKLERKKSFKTSYSGDIRILYTPIDLKENYLEALGFPGLPPFTRGIYPDMYRGKIWTMRQYAGFGDAEETNKRFHYLLQRGQSGLSCAFDLPTQMGIDSDDKRARGEVGKVGVAIDTIYDMENLFDKIPLENISTSMTINATAPIILAMYIAVAEKNGVAKKKLRGTVQNDILKEYIARGTYIYPPEGALKLTTDLILFCREYLPLFNPISISGYHIREAGSDSVQEVAFTFSNAITYIEECLKRGVAIDEFAPRLSFFFGCHSNFFEEIAKFRAARRLWGKLMKEKFHAKDERSMMLRFHTQTAGCTLTSKQPFNNIVRVAFQALAAVLGGTQSLHTNAMDEALGLPSEEAVKIALRTQQIIAEETGVCDCVDPVGGSFAVEKLTDEIEMKVIEYLNEIEKMGGSLKAIENGFISKKISDSAYRQQKLIESMENIIVGVNKYVEKEEEKTNILKITPEIEKKQIKNLLKVKEKRSKERVKNALDKVKKSAETDGNIMFSIIEAVKSEATIGEISASLEDVFGKFKPVVII